MLGHRPLKINTNNILDFEKNFIQAQVHNMHQPVTQPSYFILNTIDILKLRLWISRNQYQFMQRIGCANL